MKRVKGFAASKGFTFTGVTRYEISQILSYPFKLLNRAESKGLSETQFLLKAQTSELNLSPNQNKYVIPNKRATISPNKCESKKSEINQNICTNLSINQEHSKNNLVWILDSGANQLHDRK